MLSHLRVCLITSTLYLITLVFNHKVHLKVATRVFKHILPLTVIQKFTNAYLPQIYFVIKPSSNLLVPRNVIYDKTHG